MNDIMIMIILGVLVGVILPYYLRFISKHWTTGKYEAQYEFLIKKGLNDGKEEIITGEQDKN